MCSMVLEYLYLHLQKNDHPNAGEHFPAPWSIWDIHIYIWLYMWDYIYMIHTTINIYIYTYVYNVYNVYIYIYISMYNILLYCQKVVNFYIFHISSQLFPGFFQAIFASELSGPSSAFVAAGSAARLSAWLRHSRRFVDQRPEGQPGRCFDEVMESTA